MHLRHFANARKYHSSSGELFFTLKFTSLNQVLYIYFQVGTMRIILFIFLMAMIGCRKEAVLSIKHSNENKTIALQPLNGYSETELSFLQKELSSFFNASVVILPSIPIPSSYRVPGTIEGYSYSADSIIQFLLKNRKGFFNEVIGLTHEELFTIKKSTIPNTSSVFSFFQMVRGLGYISENACVISDHSFMSTDTTILHKRLRKVVLHEVGHNLGLEHCPVDNCLMSEKNSDNTMLDKGTGDYCEGCKRKLN